MADKYEQVIELAKRRGFLWGSFELYGGTAGFYDYGPLGAMPVCAAYFAEFRRFDGEVFRAKL